MNGTVEQFSNQLQAILGLHRKPVGVKFVENDQIDISSEYDQFTKTRYCQALMRAGNAV